MPVQIAAASQRIAPPVVWTAAIRPSWSTEIRTPGSNRAPVQVRSASMTCDGTGSPTGHVASQRVTPPITVSTQAFGRK